MLQEYQYEIGPEDYLAYHKYHFAHDSRIRTRVTLLRAISALALLAIGLILNIKGHVNAVSIAVFAVLAVCAWMLVPQCMQDGAYKTAEKKYAPRIQPYQAVTTMQEDGDVTGAFHVGAVAEGAGKLFWVTSDELLNSRTDAMVSGGNSNLFMNALNWMGGQEESISIRAKPLSSETLTLSSRDASLWSAVVVGVVPVALVAVGVVIWFRRKRR